MANEVEQKAPTGLVRVIGVKSDGEYVPFNDFPKAEAFRVIDDLIRSTPETVGTKFYAYDDQGRWLRGPLLSPDARVP
jgi:hypothetical protein